MPICENCLSHEYETLQIKLPKSMKSKNRKRDFRGREKASICFTCIKLYARTALDPNGYWHKIVFPQSHRKSRGNPKFKTRGRPKKS